MKFGHLLASFEIEDTLNSPWFELADLRLPVLKSLFESINPKFQIESGDLRVHATESLGELRVSLSAFRGSGLVEISPTGTKMKFESLRTAADYQVVADFSQRADGAIRSHLPTTAIGNRAIRRTMHLKKVAGFDERRFLASLISADGRVDPRKFGADESEYGTRMRILSKEWAAELSLDRSVLPEASLFVATSVVFSTDVRPISNCIQDAESTVAGLLLRFDIEVTPET